jgi:hypothetical protein
MTLKTSALLALAGMILVTILLVMSLIVNISGLMSGVVPILTVLKSVIHVFAAVTLTAFLYVFHGAQR